MAYKIRWTKEDGLFAHVDSGLILTKEATVESGALLVVPINRAEAEVALAEWKKMCSPPSSLSLMEVPDSDLELETPIRIALNLRYNY